ncbi:MAG: DUF4465 domain-containing protein [Bacteroidia bacterium]|nr:DUF4465 domain-containing protein [Bacteroidia bacterium]
MKKTFLLSLMLFCALNSTGQLLVADFETFTLSPNTYYKDTTGAPFITANATFQHQYSKFGNSWFWTGGFAYTNVNDSANGTFTNLYGVRAYKGYNASSKFVVGQDRAVIQLASAQNTVDGFYVTNTTYAYKMMLLGDTANGFSRKFGDTTGTGSGTTIAQGAYPDFFKLTVKGYDNGQLKSDSVVFYLADFRSNNSALDYIVDTWQWVNTSSLGEVDSLKFWMYSSDVGQFGINTPLFFALDNFTSNGVILGLNENEGLEDVKVYPSPVHDLVRISTEGNFPDDTQLRILDLQGKTVFSNELSASSNTFDLSGLPSGLYLFEISNSQTTKRIKVLKDE